MSGGGGNDQSGQTQYNWNPTMTGYWAGPDGHPERGLLERAARLSNQGYQPYRNQTEIGNIVGGPTQTSQPGQRIAGMTPDQVLAMNNIRHTATGYGAPDTAAARNEAMLTSQGHYLSGQGSNPWAGVYSGEMGLDPSAKERNPFVGQAATVMGMNPYGNPNVAPEYNQYSGDNPYFRATLEQGMGDITDAYKRGTAADTAKMFAQSRAFGGSAHQEAQANNENVLARNLGRYANEMGQSQYDRSANLREADIGRRLGAGQFNAGQGFQGWENLANRTLQGGLADLQRNSGLEENRAGRRSGAYENLAQRNLQNQQFNLNRGTGTWENERNRMMQGVGLGQQGQGLSLAAANALMGSGGAQQNLQNQLLQQNYGDWAQEQNWDRGQIDWLSNFLGRAQGTTGASQTSQSGYGANPLSQILGAGMLARGMFGG